MSEFQNSGGEHGEAMVGLERVGPAEIYTLESKVRDLMKHPKTALSQKNQKSGMSEVGPASYEELEDGEDYPYWRTSYRKGNRIIEIQALEPGREKPGGGDLAYVEVAELIHVTESGHRVIKSDVYEIEPDRVFNEEKVVEYDAQGNKVRTPRDEAEIAAMNQGDFSLLAQRARERIQARMAGSLTKNKFNELMTLLNSLTPEDEEPA